MALYRSTNGHTTVEPKLGTAGVDLACDNEHSHGWDHHLTPADAYALGQELLTLALRAGHRPAPTGQSDQPL